MRTATVDRTGVRGPGVRIDWTDLPADGRVRWPFDAPFENFRHLDALSRAVVIAVEALGVKPDPGSAIVFASATGCLETDRAFERSRHEELRPALFPYTLPSAPIAAVAIRHAITGPGLSLSVAPGDHSSALEEAGRLFATNEARSAIVCLGDVVLPHSFTMTAHYLTA